MRFDEIEASAEGATAYTETQVAEPDAWRVLAQSDQLQEFASVWILLLCRSYPDVQQAAVLIGPADKGPFELIATWPERPAAGSFANAGEGVLKAALEKRRPAVEGLNDGGQAVQVGYPLVFSGLLNGAVLVEARLPDATAVRRLIRHLQWSAAGIEAFIGRDTRNLTGRLADKAQFVLSAVDEIAASDRGRDAARTLANLLAHRFQCDSVAVGRRHGQNSRLVALSQTANFDCRAALSRQIEAAQDEAIDQQTSLLAPHADRKAPFVAAIHEEVSKTTGGSFVLTAPLTAGLKIVGAVTLRRQTPAFSQEEIDLIDALASASGTLLEQKWQMDRSLPVLMAEVRDFFGKLIGPRNLGLKFAFAAAIAAALFLTFAHDEYRIRAKAQIQGEVRRLIAAPFDGYIRTQFARAGDIVKENFLLAELQDNDLVLERLRQIARRRQYQLELNKGLAKRDLAETNIAQSQIEQTQADIDLSDQMIARAQLRAPFDSVVVSGDLSQSVGRPVARGDTLFELAPLDRYRVTAVVPEAEIRSIRVGQNGELLLSALPDRTYRMEVLSITPVAQAADGVNGYEVIASLTDRDDRIRPGMEGIVKIEAGQRNLAWIWGHPLVDWLRLKAWSVLP